MFLYTEKNLVDVLPIREKSFKECGIKTSNLEVICLKEGTFAFLEVEDLEKYNNSKLEDLTVQSAEEREQRIAELKAKREQEVEEAKKNTNEYKIKVLEEEQLVQNEDILTSMLATSEIFEMVLSISGGTINIKNKNAGGNNMVELYVTLILKGAKTIDDVPTIIRAQVQEQLDLVTK